MINAEYNKIIVLYIYPELCNKLGDNWIFTAYAYCWSQV